MDCQLAYRCQIPYGLNLPNRRMSPPVPLYPYKYKKSKLGLTAPFACASTMLVDGWYYVFINLIKENISHKQLMEMIAYLAKRDEILQLVQKKCKLTLYPFFTKEEQEFLERQKEAQQRLAQMNSGSKKNPNQ